jgi:hypothetical protein
MDRQTPQAIPSTVNEADKPSTNRLCLYMEIAIEHQIRFWLTTRQRRSRTQVFDLLTIFILISYGVMHTRLGTGLGTILIFAFIVYIPLRVLSFFQDCIMGGGMTILLGYK